MLFPFISSLKKKKNFFPLLMRAKNYSRYKRILIIKLLCEVKYSKQINEVDIIIINATHEIFVGIWKEEVHNWKNDFLRNRTVDVLRLFAARSAHYRGNGWNFRLGKNTKYRCYLLVALDVSCVFPEKIDHCFFIGAQL